MFVRRLVAFLALSASLYAQKLTVAAAADLGPALKDITGAFEKQTGTKADLILGSSGNFFAQIQNGAPYDFFFSADIDYARKLQEAGLAESLTIYAEGSIVLWVKNDSKLDLSRGMGVLTDPAVNKIAIANPAHAPYGRAAMSALQYFGLTDKVKDKLVLGENISQATQFVQSGNADVGITALSLALSPALKAEGAYWAIPQTAYPKMEQAAVILKSSKNRKSARAFLDFLKTSVAIQVMKRYGFNLPLKPGGPQ